MREQAEGVGQVGIKDITCVKSLRNTVGLIVRVLFYPKKNIENRRWIDNTNSDLEI